MRFLPTNKESRPSWINLERTPLIVSASRSRLFGSFGRLRYPVTTNLRFFRNSFYLVTFSVADDCSLEDQEVGRRSTEPMTSGTLCRHYDEIVTMDVACNVDLTDTADIPYSAGKRLHRFEEPDVEERVKRPLNAFMVWSQVFIRISPSHIYNSMCNYG